jgi:predicted MPP superfamily phosphohydrolase
MSLFFLIFFTVYSGMHFYAFLRARAAFQFGFAAGIPAGLFMLLMIASPFIIRLSEAKGYEFFARIASYIGYTWMGVLFLFVSSSFVLEIYRLILRLSGLVLKRDLSFLIPSAKPFFLICLGLAMSIAAYGYFEALNIRAEHKVIKTPKIPASIGRIRIAQISDVHIGLIVRQQRLSRILGKVKEANPDILISTGDLVDGQINRLDGLAGFLSEIKPKYGKFAITGNHEFYAGLKQAVEFTEKSGFKVLRGESLTVEGILNIAAVDDPAGRYYGLTKDVPEDELLAGLPKDNFTLLLKHRPSLNKPSIGLFDLQLSGHAHKGQIFPFGLVTRLVYPTDYGYLRLAGNSAIYVSRGAGTWGPPIRFLAPPEVAVIDLVHEDKQGLLSGQQKNII